MIPRTLTAGGGDALPHPTPSPAFGWAQGTSAPIYVGTQTLVPLNFSGLMEPLFVNRPYMGGCNMGTAVPLMSQHIVVPCVLVSSVVYIPVALAPAPLCPVVRNSYIRPCVPLDGDLVLGDYRNSVHSCGEDKSQNM